MQCGTVLFNVRERDLGSTVDETQKTEYTFNQVT
jgi:hypothetical protein